MLICADDIQVHTFPKVNDVDDVAQNILEKRYLHEGETTWEDVVTRTVDFVIQDEGVLKDRIWELMAHRYFLPNSPTLVNSGKKHAGLSACFVVGMEDTIEDIFTTKLNFALIARKGGGCGTTLSNLRPKNSPVAGSTHGYAGGPVDFFNTICHDMSVITQAGFRAMAMMGTLHVRHPDIKQFILAKQEEGKMSNTNISVIVDNAFMQAVEDDVTYWTEFNGEKYEEYRAKEIFDMIVDGAWRNGEPGVVFEERINDSPYKYTGQKIQGLNPCVVGNTWIQTDRGAKQVRDILGEQVAVMVGGKKYLSDAVGFFSTGIKQVYNICTKHGYKVQATKNHLINTVNGWKRVDDLSQDDKLILNSHSNLEWGKNTESEIGYLLGLLVGDGTFSNNNAVISVWNDGSEADIIDKAENIMFTLPHRNDFVGFHAITSRNMQSIKLAALTKKAEQFGIVQGNKTITPEIEKASSAFYKEFLQGLFDADGSVQGNPETGSSIRLSQSNLELLESVQRMLLRLGIVSKIYKNRRSAGFRPMPDGKGGTKEYWTKANHELIISKENLVVYQNRIGFSHNAKIKKLTNLLEQYKTVPMKEHFVSQVTEVVSIGKKQVYDIQVPGINAFDANGIYCHNCGEQILPANGVCNLGSLDVSKFVVDGEFNDLMFISAICYAVQFLDRVIDVGQFPTEDITTWAKDNRPIGLGIMGFADYLLKLEIPYGSQESIDHLTRILEYMDVYSKFESDILADEFGIPKEPAKLPNPRRNITLLSIAPTGTIALLAGCSNSIEPVFSEVTIRKDNTGTYDIRHPLAHKEYFRCAVSANGAAEVTWKEHVDVQSAAQAIVDSGISKTINLPALTRAKTVGDIFMYAWAETDVKGLTVYRNQSRKEEVLTPKNIKKNKCPVCGGVLIKEAGCMGCSDCDYSVCEIG